MLIKDALLHTEEQLKESGIIPYKFEAKELLAAASNLEPARIRFSGEANISEEQVLNLQKLIDRRKSGEPLQYILGVWEFYSLPFKVGEGVLIPRADTEWLVDTALDYLKAKEKALVADLCSGSGCIAISIKKNRPDCEIDAYELSDEALEYLKANAKLNNTDINVFKQDITTNIPKKQYDLIVSNPPYIGTDEIPTLEKELSFEPNMALDGGEDGLLFYRAITEKWLPNLKKGGALMVEVGINQHIAVMELFKNAGLSNVDCICDINGIERVIIGTLPL